MKNSRSALVALLVALWAMPADAANPFRQNRDNARLTAKLGAKAEGWNWLQTSALDNYCHRVIDRLEDRAMRRLKERGRYDWFFDREDEIIDWDPKRRFFRRSSGEPPVGSNPCLLPGTEPGLQAKLEKVSATHSGMTAAVSVAECNGCYRDIGGICSLVRLTKRRAFEAADNVVKSHGKTKQDDHGIGETARAAAETLAACEGSQR